MAQFLLHVINVGLSIAAMRMWYKAGSLNALIESVRWWPLSLFVNNLFFSLVAVIDVNIVDFVSPVFLNYWSQAVRIHMLIVFIVGALRMIEIIKRRSDHA